MVGSWNVGSITGKLLELGDVLERHRVDIACFQETKWKGSSTKEGNGYNLWYSGSKTGSQTARNGVGIIVKECLKDKVVHVNRCSDRIISLTLVIEGETVNVISAYVLQVGLGEDEKKTFWDSLDEVVRVFPTDQQLILGGDLNGHIGEATERYPGVHGGFGYGVRNEEGRAILDFATAHDVAVVNSYFKKRDHHLITFQSGGRCTQIDYLLVRRGDLKACKDCIVFRGEACSSQHRLLALDTLFKSVRRMREISAVPRILWKNLKGDATEEFRSRFVVEGVSTQREVISASDADTMWNTLASIIKDTAKDSLGVAIGSSKTHTARRESWWLCEEVQSKVAEKQASVPRKLIWKTLVNKGTSRRYIKVIKDMYDGARTRVQTPMGNTEFFPVEVRLHQRSAISPYLFALILDELSRGIQEDIPWCLIFADDIALVSKSAEGLNNRLEIENRREALEDNGLSVSREKTEYLRCDFGKVEIAHNEEVDICIGDKILQPKESFRYLGSMIHKSERIDEDVSHRIKSAWLNVAIRPSMLYGSECWPITKAIANRMEVAELRMLRWTCGKTMLDMIPNEVCRAELEVETIIKKMKEGRLRWFRHVRRRPQSAPVRRVEALVVDGVRRRGRPKLRWEDRVKHDLKELLLSENMTWSKELESV
uniref:Reverse transcriptase domain-containing protein n=1 Tax=Tanacetum cinerariifolium TaxID=118510 RepID=A0A6L2JU57_TANCI|nr:hypothetical protein [Tanacetum cinerariifolium]